MTAKEIVKIIRTDEMNGCNDEEFQKKHERLINQYTRHIAEQAVEVEKKVWCKTYERVFKDILTRINELTQTNEDK